MKKGSVIIETRLLFNLKEVVDNHLKFLPGDWGLTIFGSKQNERFFREHYPKAEFVFIGDEKEVDQKAYNEILTSSWFWKSLTYDKILIFQHDSRMLREGIEEFLEYDYVGAPWGFQMHGGNGGFSLRSKQAMIDIIENSRPYPYRFPEDGNEDVWFCNQMKRNEKISQKWKLAPREVCQLFSVESIYHLGTLGYHAIDKYLTPLEIMLIESQYDKQNEKLKNL